MTASPRSTGRRRAILAGAALVVALALFFSEADPTSWLGRRLGGASHPFEGRAVMRTPCAGGVVVFLPPADARAAFERGSVDAWVIWDPYQAAAEQQLQARTLRDGKGIVDNNQFYLATKPYAQQHPKVLQTLVEEVRAVGEWSKANPDEVTKQVAPLLGLPEDITKVSVKRQGYGALFITPETIAAQQKIADTFYQLKLIPKPLSIADVIWTPPAAVAKAQ